MAASKDEESKDKEPKSAGSKTTLITWLQVRGDTSKGALSGGIDAELDLPITGTRKGTTPDAD
jgi:hypothetical protein